MRYKNLSDCIADLEKHGRLVRVKEEVDPHLEMAAMHLRVHAAGGKAILFEKVKGCQFQCVSNLFGTAERAKFLFRDTLDDVRQIIGLKDNPLLAVKKPALALKARRAIPKETSFRRSDWIETTIDKLPQIKHWPDDGGAFITLPLVYTEDIETPGVMNSNLGMYRIQLSGNEYLPNKEVGLHYQIHRGIGMHQSKANAKGKPLKVSIFAGGTPAMIFSAVMPLPEGMSELTFAGVLGGKKISYSYDDGFFIYNDADFVITGEVYPGENKPEGPFGDHFGYYSLRHDFPVMRVRKVYHKKNAIWPFTVVGRPPQEDTQFGKLIHEITGDVLTKEIPGLKEVNAVDAAGVHPLLLAIGSERYTPYIKVRKPQEILTIANHILGTGQMSLAKYVLICAREDNQNLSANDIPAFFRHLLERVDWTRDLHFYTRTTIDTLDYSGTDLNSGSKVVIAAAGEKKRDLATGSALGKIVLPGILCIRQNKFSDYASAENEIANCLLPTADLIGVMLTVIVDDIDFATASLNNFLWTTFTKSNPSHDIYGINSFVENKHWGCRGPLIIDARSKPHHAPALLRNEPVEKRIAPIVSAILK